MVLGGQPPGRVRRSHVVFFYCIKNKLMFEIIQNELRVFNIIQNYLGLSKSIQYYLKRVRVFNII